MTDTGDALLRAICLNPDDDAPRLIYADWLEENGSESEAEQIRYFVSRPQLTTTTFLVIRYVEGTLVSHFRRGFVDELHCTLAEFMQFSQDIALRHPVRKWVLTDCKPFRDNLFRNSWWKSIKKLNGNRIGGFLPKELFRFLSGSPCGGLRIQYATEAEAIADLEQACYHYARQKLLATVSTNDT